MLSPLELSLYDRQIRLWGLDKQSMIRDTIIGVIGSFKDNGSIQEVLKNMALKGVGKIVLFNNNAPCSVGGGFGGGLLFSSLNFFSEIKLLNPSVEWEEVYSFNDVIKMKPIMICVFDSPNNCNILNDNCIVNGIPLLIIFDISSSCFIFSSFRISYSDFCNDYMQRWKLSCDDKKFHKEFIEFLIIDDNNVPSLMSISSNHSLYRTSLNAIVGAVTSQEIFKIITASACLSEKGIFIDVESLESTIIS